MDMTRYDMTCDAVAERLADYLEDDASGLVRDGIEAHAAGCAPCAALLADLAALSQDARALPPLVPSRDLWRGIAERIDAPVLPLEGARPVHGLPARGGWARPAVAAAALVLFTAGVTNLLTRASMSSSTPVAAARDTGVSPVATQGAGTTPLDASGTEAATVEGTSPDRDTERTARVATRGGEERVVERGEAQPGAAQRGPAPARLASTGSEAAGPDPVYDRDMATLRKLVRERRAQLDPATVAVLEQSVAVIDSAIAQSRAALAKDPASRFLATQLNHSLEKKIELLRTAAMLPART
jgi:hypothetical protein